MNTRRHHLPRSAHTGALAGQSLGGVFSQLLIKQTVAGDTNLDGVVSSADYLNVVANMGRANAQWFLGDLNCDGVVTVDDLAVVSGNLGAGVALAAGPGVTGESAKAKMVLGEKTVKKPVVKKAVAQKKMQRSGSSKVQAGKGSRG